DPGLRGQPRRVLSQRGFVDLVAGGEGTGDRGDDSAIVLDRWHGFLQGSMRGVAGFAIAVRSFHHAATRIGWSNADSALSHAPKASAMNLIWLEDFLALASTGNFSRAAEERHMTQPAFSRRIRALEEWLGVVLIDRTTHPVALTEAGEWFRSVAQDILARVGQIPDEARAIADATSATLR